MTDKVVVLVTASSKKEAGKIATALIDGRVAACVNVIEKMQSYYRWKGEVQCDSECLLVIRSSRAHFAELRKAVEKVHSYKVPEIICLPIVEGADPYMNWLEESLAAATPRAKPAPSRR